LIGRFGGRLTVGVDHEPSGYRCPVCRIVAGADRRDGFTKQADVVLRGGTVTAFVSFAWWPANPGHVLVVPNAHYENIYPIPDAVLAAVQAAGKRIALALKATYGCDGASFRQHNEPAGNQEIWHYHLQSSRYHGDDLERRTRERRDTTPAERVPYAQKLRHSLARR